jgi:hypothetical protein
LLWWCVDVVLLSSSGRRNCDLLCDYLLGIHPLL